MPRSWAGRAAPHPRSGPRAALGVAFVAALSGCGTASPTVVINEVTSSGRDAIELFNVETRAVDLSGWTVTDLTPDVPGHRYTFPANVALGAGEYRVLLRGVDHAFSLGDTGGVELVDASGLLTDSVEYEGGVAVVSFCRRPNATGFFQACSTATFGTNNDVGCGDPARTVVINEVAAKGGAIELYNTAKTTVDLSGWRLTDGAPDSPGHRSALPAGVALAPGAFLVVYQGIDFAFNLGLDDVARLEAPDGCLRDAADYGPGQAEVSWCRLPDGTGDFAACSTPTFGGANQP